MCCKQVILVRDDLKLPKGKLAAQVAHASLDAALNSSKAKLAIWRATGSKKVVLKVKDIEELEKYESLARQKKLRTAMISDAGRTVVAPGTVTCLAIGPDKEKLIDEVTGTLKML